MRIEVECKWSVRLCKKMKNILRSIMSVQENETIIERKVKHLR